MKSKTFKKYVVYCCLCILCLSILFLLIFKLCIDAQNNTNYITNSETYKNKYLITNLYSNSDKFISKYIGRIKITSLNIDYPIFSYLSEENLKLAPCLFSGSSFVFSDNICIAGHNYDNHMFFSDLKNINLHDKVSVTLPNNATFVYSVFNIYEVDSHDFSPILSSSFDFELTLITCNNKNSKRLIVKCKR